jgi:hypothetical protein
MTALGEPPLHALSFGHVEVDREVVLDDDVRKLRAVYDVGLGESVLTHNSAGLPDLRSHRRRHEVGALEAWARVAQMLHEGLHLTAKLDLGSGQVVGPRPVPGYACRVDDSFPAFR